MYRRKKSDDMTENEISAIVKSVLESALKTSKSDCSCEIPVEASARHVHLTVGAVEKLFGKGARLQKVRDLSQPGEFLSDKRVKLVTPKGEIVNVAVLGPERSAVQVELSITDARSLGLDPPVNLSGNLSGAADVLIYGENSFLEAPGSVIIAKNHIHMTPADAQRFGVADGSSVNVRVSGKRTVCFEGVAVRVSEKFALAMHLDFDEFNACGLTKCASGTLVGAAAGSSAYSPSACSAARNSACTCEAKVITEAMAVSLAKSGSAVTLRRGTVLTPSAKDVFHSKKISVEFV